MRKVSVFLFIACFGTMFIMKCSHDEDKSPIMSSRAYRGHNNDVDIKNFVQVNNHTVGTRLDDCQTCHAGGTVTISGKQRFKNPCDYCHFIPFPNSSVMGAPGKFRDTLNPYGKAYKTNGRDKNSLRSIQNQDSDGDTFPNLAEINDLKYPGDPASKPGQKTAPMIVLTMNALKAMTAHNEFFLVNTSRQQVDFYAWYAGVKIKDLLQDLNINLTGIESISVIAPDGYVKEFDLDDCQNQFPNGLYFSGLDVGTLGTACGFVQYPTTMPAELANGGSIPHKQFLMLAYTRDSGPIDPAYLDPTSGSIEGEGPYRIILPQSTPGSPDRGQDYSPTSCNVASTMTTRRIIMQAQWFGESSPSELIRCPRDMRILIIGMAAGHISTERNSLSTVPE